LISPRTEEFQLDKKGQSIFESPFAFVDALFL